MDRIRVLRILEYTGPRAQVEEQVSRSLHGERRLPNGVTIKAVTVGNYPEMLEGLPVVEGLPGAKPEKGYPAGYRTTLCASCHHNHLPTIRCGFMVDKVHGLDVTCDCEQ